MIEMDILSHSHVHLKAVGFISFLQASRPLVSFYLRMWGCNFQAVITQEMFCDYLMSKGINRDDAVEAFSRWVTEDMCRPKSRNRGLFIIVIVIVKLFCDIDIQKRVKVGFTYKSTTLRWRNIF